MTSTSILRIATDYTGNHRPSSGASLGSAALVHWEMMENAEATAPKDPRLGGLELFAGGWGPPYTNPRSIHERFLDCA